jgi:polyhydroxyalkanoate synthesis repressor PhaR
LDQPSAVVTIRIKKIGLKDGASARLPHPRYCNAGEKFSARRPPRRLRRQMTEAQPPGDRVVIKKYANRRLYNTRSSAYVTLEHLSEMVKQGVDFVVYDAKTNEDITRSVLTQIIFDEESRGQNLLPIQFLRQLIRFYGDSMQAFVPGFLELSLDSFSRQQDHLRGQPPGVMGGAVGLGLLEEQVRQNMVMFDRAMKMFTPFAFARPEGPQAQTAPPAPEPPAEAAPAPPPAPEAASDTSLDDLKQRIEEMQREIAKLAAKS